MRCGPSLSSLRGVMRPTNLLAMVGRVRARRDLLVGVGLTALTEAELHGRPVLSVLLGLGVLGVTARARFPARVLVGLTALLVVDAVCGGVLVADLMSPLLAVAWAASGVGARVRAQWSVVACAAAVVLLTVADQIGSPGRFASLNDVAFYAIAVVAPAVVGAVVADRSRQIRQLRELSSALEADRDLPAEVARAAEAERLRNAVDSVVADQIRALIADAACAELNVRGSPLLAREAMARVESAARAVLNDLREVIGTLELDGSGGRDTAGAAEAESRPEVIRALSGGDRGRRPGRSRLVDHRVDLLFAGAAVPVAVEIGLTSSRQGPLVANLAACAVLAAVLGDVRHRPLAAAAAMVVLVTAANAWLTPAPATVTWLLPPLLVGFTIGAREPARRAVPGLLGLLLGMVVSEWVVPGGPVLDGLGPTAAMITAAWVCGRLVRSRGRRVEVLAELTASLEAGRQLRARLAVAMQRAEFARELHDVGAHAMTVVCLQAGAAQRIWTTDPDAALSAVRTVAAVSRDSLRHISETFSAVASDRSTAGMGVAEVEPLAGVARVLGLQVAVTVEGMPQALPPAVELVAFRVVQEALTNAVRYAARSAVDVSLRYLDEEFVIEVRDTGPQSTTEVSIEGSGRGLRGMRERVEQCRGELSCGTQPTGGFAVRACLPLATRTVST